MKFFFIILFSLAPCLILAQKQESRSIDSLMRLLPGQKEDTNKVKLLNDISALYHTVDPVEGIKYGERGLELAGQLAWKTGIADADNTLGLNYQYKSDYPTAMDYDFRALKIFEETGDRSGAAKIMRNIASIYQYEKNYPKVLEYNMKALKIFDELGDKNGLSATFSNIGIFYFFLKDYQKALEYDFKALAICEELHTKSAIASNEGNIGDTYKYTGDYGKSLEYSFKSLELFEELGDKYGIAIDLGNIGEAYYAVATDTARHLQLNTYIPVGKAANLRKAIDYLQKSIDASREIDQLDNIIEFNQYLSDAYLLEGDYRNALESYKQYTRTYDSVYSARNSVSIKQTEHNHELELRDKDLQIAKLAVAKRRNERIFFIAGIAVLLLIIAIILRNYGMQSKTNRLLKLANNRLVDEKKRSDDLLLNILPAEVADELKATGGAVAKYFDNVTVMFTDFVNFTQAGERMNPQQLIEELHTCFKAFDEIIGRYNIEKIKTIGDAYLAVSGLPIVDPEHAEHIVNAAIEISDYMRYRQSQMHDKTFEMRIGIHSGSVVAGIVGVKKFAYDIWGDTVNTASRMEENSEAGKVNISQTTYELVKNKFHCTYRGEIEAKNKGSLQMYFVAAADK